MKIVQLITYRNSVLRDHLMNAGYTLVEFIEPLSDADITELSDRAFNDYRIIEIVDDNKERSTDLIDIVSKSGKVICIAHTMTEKLKQTLLEKGISDVIQANDVNRLVKYLKVIDNDTPRNLGKMLILDNDNHRKKIFNNILSRFGYETIFIKTLDDLFENLNSLSLQFILINIGMDNLDINDLIRRSHSRVEMRKTPVIAFKDMSQGIYLHEVVTGLNKLTKTILSTEELYSFLLNVLFAKEIIPITGIINKSLDYENLQYYSQETLSQIYFKNIKNIFASNKIINDENIENMLHLVALFRKAIIKIDGLKWLKMKDNNVNFNSCGLGGRNLNHL